MKISKNFICGIFILLGVYIGFINVYAGNHGRTVDKNSILFFDKGDDKIYEFDYFNEDENDSVTVVPMIRVLNFSDPGVDETYIVGVQLSSNKRGIKSLEVLPYDEIDPCFLMSIDKEEYSKFFSINGSNILRSEAFELNCIIENREDLKYKKIKALMRGYGYNTAKIYDRKIYRNKLVFNTKFLEIVKNKLSKLYKDDAPKFIVDTLLLNSHR